MGLRSLGRQTRYLEMALLCNGKPVLSIYTGQNGNIQFPTIARLGDLVKIVLGCAFRLVAA